jgi:hypothetical protein
LLFPNAFIGNPGQRILDLDSRVRGNGDLSFGFQSIRAQRDVPLSRQKQRFRFQGIPQTRNPEWRETQKARKSNLKGLMSRFTFKECNEKASTSSCPSATHTEIPNSPPIHL